LNRRKTLFLLQARSCIPQCFFTLLTECSRYLAVFLTQFHLGAQIPELALEALIVLATKVDLNACIGHLYPLLIRVWKDHERIAPSAVKLARTRLAVLVLQVAQDGLPEAQRTELLRNVLIACAEEEENESGTAVRAVLGEISENYEAVGFV
jgi:hypothetical protein